MGGLKGMRGGCMVVTGEEAGEGSSLEGIGGLG